MQVQHKEKKHAKYRISFILLFIIASFAICFDFYMKEDFDVYEAVMKSEPPEKVSALPEIPVNVKKVVNPVQKSEKADDTYFNSAAFVGGKRISGLADYMFVPRGNVYTNDELSVKSAGTDEEGNPLTYDELIEFLKGGRFKTIYFMAGFCDLGAPEEGLFDGLDSVVSEITSNDPEVNVYFVSLLPVTASYEKDNITNINIDAYNTYLLRYANMKNVYYLDLNTVFVGNDGKMPDILTEPDGFRLKKDTYSEIADYMLTHIGV